MPDMCFQSPDVVLWQVASAVETGTASDMASPTSQVLSCPGMACLLFMFSNRRFRQ
jgi:hypothetical protein